MVGCGERRPGGDPPTAPAPVAAGDCTLVDYPPAIDVAEASGAAWLPGADRLLVVSDSGHDGAYVELDARGAVRARGRLPLGGSGDDVEGLARDGEIVWGVASSGWSWAWRRIDTTYVLVAARALDSACAPAAVNCGANYEGMCLAAAPLADGCAGYLASKTTGELVCLRRDQDRLTLDGDRRYPVAGGGRLADCAIADDGTVWTGDNGFDLGQVRQWSIGAGGATLLGEARLGVGFPEVLAFGPERTVYRFSDLGGAPSLALAYRCPAGLPKAGPGGGGG